jgi:hypothetical protein
MNRKAFKLLRMLCNSKIGPKNYEYIFELIVMFLFNQSELFFQVNLLDPLLFHFIII